MKKKTILLGLIMAGTFVTVTSCGKKSTSSNNKDDNNTTTQESQKPADQHSIYYIVDGKVVNTVNYKDGDTSVIELGVPKKEGYEGVWSNYTLNGDDIYVVAIYYKKNVNYKIEYYLQNLDDDNYTKDVNYVGQFTTTEGKTIKPEIRQYVGFTCINSEVEQTIDEENNTIKVYYSRNLFTVNYTTNNGTTIQEETVKYGKILT